MSSKKPLRFVVSGALLIGSLTSCKNDVPPNEPMPETNVGREEPVSNDPAPNETDETEVFTNEVLLEQPTDEPEPAMPHANTVPVQTPAQ